MNPDVVIKEMPARTLCALTWKGKSPREAEIQARRAVLAALMAEAGLEPQGPLHCWQVSEGWVAGQADGRAVGHTCCTVMCETGC